MVILADAACLRRSIDDPYVGDTVRAQVTGADIIVLNKMDLVAEASRGVLLDWVAGEWPGAAVLPVTGGAAPVDLVLGIGGTQGAGSALGHADGLFESMVLEVPGDFDASALAEAIATGGYGVVRAKGQLWVATAHAYPVDFHTAGQHLELVPSDVPYLAAVPEAEWDEDDREQHEHIFLLSLPDGPGKRPLIKPRLQLLIIISFLF